MKISKIVLFIIILVSLRIPNGLAEETIETDLDIFPEPVYGQINSGENYWIKFSILNKGLEISDTNTFTGNILTILVIEWWVKGSYHYGGAVTGYSTLIDDITYNETIKLPEIDSPYNVTFSHEFSRDSFDLGVHPYQTIKIKFEATTYIEVLNETIEKTMMGEKIGNNYTEVSLLDDIKIGYVEGKLQDLEDEIGVLDVLAPSETTVDMENYLNILEDMNSFIAIGDYFNAFDVYQDYENRERRKLISEIIINLNTSLYEVSKVPQLESKIERIDKNYQNIQSQFIQLQEEYHSKQRQLEDQRELTTTAFTGIWVVGIFAFILGLLAHRIPSYLKGGED